MNFMWGIHPDIFTLIPTIHIQYKACPNERCRCGGTYIVAFDFTVFIMGIEFDGRGPK
jgi:hypothetical protein